MRRDGDDYTAKYFRTWGASVLAYEAIVTADADLGRRSVPEPVTQALAPGAQQLRPP